VNIQKGLIAWKMFTRIIECSNLVVVSAKNAFIGLAVISAAKTDLFQQTKRPS